MDKQSIIFIFGSIITVLGMAIGFLQLYIVSNFNNISKRMDGAEGNIVKLWENNRECISSCEQKRRVVKEDIRRELETS